MATKDVAATSTVVVGHPIVLHQFRPAWDLQAYMRFKAISYHVENSSYPEYESTGELPQLQHGKVAVGWRKALKYLKSVRKDKDEGLSESDKADAVAFSALLQGPLRDAVLYYQWSDEKRYEKVTRKLTASAMLTPLSWFVPAYTRSRYVAYLDTAGWADELSIEQEVKAAYVALEAKLGSKPYLFGEEPTSVDALLYGHLVTSRNEPSLYAMLSKHPLLLEFHKRILTTYFPDDLTQSGVGYLCTQGLNVFEQHDKDAEKARAAAKGKGTGTSVDTADVSPSEVYWRWAIISTGVILLGASVILSRGK